MAHEVTNHGFDRDGLHAIADKGCFTGPEVMACHQAGIENAHLALVAGDSFTRNTAARPLSVLR